MSLLLVRYGIGNYWILYIKVNFQNVQKNYYLSHFTNIYRLLFFSKSLNSITWSVFIQVYAILPIPGSLNFYAHYQWLPQLHYWILVVFFKRFVYHNPTKVLSYNINWHCINHFNPYECLGRFHKSHPTWYFPFIKACKIDCRFVINNTLEELYVSIR